MALRPRIDLPFPVFALVEAVLDAAGRGKADYRTAAYMISVDRVAKAMELIGF